MNPVGIARPRRWKSDLRPREDEGQTHRRGTQDCWVRVQCALLKRQRRPKEQSLFSTQLSVSKSHTSGFKDQGEMFSSLQKLAT